MTVLQSLNMVAYDQHCLPALSLCHCGADKSPPVTDMRFGRKRKPHRTVKATARIPAAALLHVVQNHLYRIALTCLEVWRGIYLESIIAIHPASCLLSVYVDNRFCHSPVKIEHGMPITLRNYKFGTVETFAYPWQAARTSAFLRGDLLAVLLYGHKLQVPLPIERTSYGPVMRNTYGMPCLLVARELPIADV